MEWKQIFTQDDAEELLKIFGYFHDGCIHETHLFTGHYVEDNLSMSSPGNLQR